MLLDASNLHVLNFNTFLRQKQYFEQRRRLQHGQQQTAGLESYADGIDISVQHQREHRSLDVLSLLHLSTITQECKSAGPCGMFSPCQKSKKLLTTFLQFIQFSRSH